MTSFWCHLLIKITMAGNVYNVIFYSSCCCNGNYTKTVSTQSKTKTACKIWSQDWLIRHNSEHCIESVILNGLSCWRILVFLTHSYVWHRRLFYVGLCQWMIGSDKKWKKNKFYHMYQYATYENFADSILTS